MLGNAIWCLWLNNKKKVELITEAMKLYQKVIDDIQRKTTLAVEAEESNALERINNDDRINSPDSQGRTFGSLPKNKTSYTKGEKQKVIIFEHPHKDSHMCSSCGRK